MYIIKLEEKNLHKIDECNFITASTTSIQQCLRALVMECLKLA